MANVEKLEEIIKAYSDLIEEVYYSTQDVKCDGFCHLHMGRDELYKRIYDVNTRAFAAGVEVDTYIRQVFDGEFSF